MSDERATKPEAFLETKMFSSIGIPEIVTGLIVVIAAVVWGLRPLREAPSDARIAIAAYRRYLKLEPQGIQAQIARQTIQQIQAVLPKAHR